MPKFDVAAQIAELEMDKLSPERGRVEQILATIANARRLPRRAGAPLAAVNSGD
jgi:hypothetical protein